MNKLNYTCVALVGVLISVPAFAQITPLSTQVSTTFFTPGNLVVVVEGCGVHGGTCTAVPHGTGTGTSTVNDNSSAGGYGDNQGAPMTLFQYTPNATASVSYVNSLVLPQVHSGANFPVSGEYGSSSEGGLQLAAGGQYLTFAGYGLDYLTFNAAYALGFTTDSYGAAPSGALAQSGSLTTASYTPVARVVTLVDANGHINSSTALYNIFDTNNPRSVFTADGVSAYISGQGNTQGDNPPVNVTLDPDKTGGVYLVPLGTTTTAPTAITGLDTENKELTGAAAQDSRMLLQYGSTLYVSVDSKEGSNYNRDYIGSLGNLPTGQYGTASGTPSVYSGPTQLTGFATSGAGKLTVTTGTHTNGNLLNSTGSSSLAKINLSPMSYFFASPTVLYVADTGNPKNDSNGDTNAGGTANIGNGGLQKWMNTSGTWSLLYTLYNGLNLVNNGSGTGTSGLYGLAGTVVSGTAYLYATNATLNDLDKTYLYGISDVVSNITVPSTSAAPAFTLLDTAPSDSNFKGVSFAPSIPAGSVEITSTPSGYPVTVAGTGCAPGTYNTPWTLAWTPGSSCTLSVNSPISAGTGVQYAFSQWEDGTIATSHTVTAPTTTATYSSTFATDYLITTVAGTGGSISAGGYEAAGSSFPITATPNNGYAFVNFTDSFGNTSTANPIGLPVTAPNTVTASFVAVAPTDVSSQVKVTSSGLVRSRATGLYTGTVTILNTGSTTIAAPLQSVFTSLIPGASLTNATGTNNGSPYITVSGGSLAPGASVSFPVSFSYSGTGTISYVSKTLSGSF